MKNTIIASFIIFTMFGNTLAMAQGQSANNSWDVIWTSDPTQSTTTSFRNQNGNLSDITSVLVNPMNVTPEQLMKLIDRTNNKSSTLPEYEVTIKTDYSAEAFANRFQNSPQSLKLQSSYNSNTKVISLTHEGSGIEYQIPMNMRYANEFSPEKILEKLEADENWRLMTDAARNVKRGRIGIQDILNLVQSSKLAAMSFPAEALTFYMGVGLNHVISLLTNYHKNPMALEMYLEELVSPVGQLGFLAFMIGNRHASALFQKVFNNPITPTNPNGNINHARVHKYIVPYFSMAVGSMFSNIAHDLVMLVQPCAEALTKRDENFNLIYTGDAIGKKCQEGWNATFTSEKASQYITASMSVILGAATSAILTAGIKGAASSITAGIVGATKRVIPINGFVIASQKLARSAVVKKVIKSSYNAVVSAGSLIIGGPIKLGLRMAGITLFLKSDEYWHDYIHQSIESKFFSGPSLLDNKKYTHVLEQMIQDGNFESKFCFDNTTPFGILTPHLSFKDCTIKKVLSEVYQSHDKHMAWRKNHLYPFDSGYAIWMRYLTEFTQMQEASESIMYNMLSWIGSIEKDSKDPKSEFNPFVHDNPLNGVTPSDAFTKSDYENIKSNSSDFDAQNFMKATRLVESLEKIDRIIKQAQSLKRIPPETVTLVNDYVARLTKIKELIEKYRDTHITSNKEVRNELLSKSQNTTNTLWGKSFQLWETFKSFASNWKQTIGTVLTKETITPKQRTEKYDDLASALKILNETFIKFSQLPSRVALYDNSARHLLKNSIRELRTFIGKPYPVKVNEAFIALFNDYLKENYEEIEHVWMQPEIKTPVETLIRELVCSEPYNSPAYQASTRRDGALDYLDYGLAHVSKFINKITFGSVEKYGSLYTGKPIAEGLGKLFNYGTGLNYTAPSLITANREEVKRICENKLIPILPKNSNFEIDLLTYFKHVNGVLSMGLGRTEPKLEGTSASFNDSEYFKSNGEAYGSLYEYLLKNINPDLTKLAANTSDSGEAVQFNDWYDQNLKPIFNKVLAKMAVDYKKLLDNEYKEALLGKEFNFNKFLRNAWSSMFKARWALPGHVPVRDIVRPELYNRNNSRGVLEDYVHQMERYTRLIEIIYGKMIEKQPQIAAQITTELSKRGVNVNASNFSLSDGFATEQTPPRFISDLRVSDQKLTVEQNKAYFKRTINKLKSNVYELLTSLKEMEMEEKDIWFIPTSRGEVPEAPRSIGKRADFETLFAETLVNFKHVLQVLNISDEATPILKSLRYSELFKEVTKENKTLAIANDRLMLRIQNTESIGEKVSALALDRNIMNYLLGFRQYSQEELEQYFSLRPVFTNDTIVKDGFEISNTDVKLAQVNPIYPHPMVERDLQAAYRSADPISWGVILETRYDMTAHDSQSQLTCDKTYPPLTRDEINEITQRYIDIPNVAEQIQSIRAQENARCKLHIVNDSILHEKELLSALAVTNELYSMIEDIYAQVVFITAAQPDSKYHSHIENQAPTESRGGQGSRRGF